MDKFINVEKCIDNIERIYCEKCPGDYKHKDNSYYMKYTCTNCLSPFNIDFLKHYIECEPFITFDNKTTITALKQTISDIENLPTTDVVEAVHGEWVECDDGWDGVYYECSACKEAFTLIDGTPTDNLYNFCPNCGADMRGGEKDG